MKTPPAKCEMNRTIKGPKDMKDLDNTLNSERYIRHGERKTDVEVEGELCISDLGNSSGSNRDSPNGQREIEVNELRQKQVSYLGSKYDRNKVIRDLEIRKEIKGESEDESKKYIREEEMMEIEIEGQDDISELGNESDSNSDSRQVKIMTEINVERQKPVSYISQKFGSYKETCHLEKKMEVKVGVEEEISDFRGRKCIGHDIRLERKDENQSWITREVLRETEVAVEGEEEITDSGNSGKSYSGCDTCHEKSRIEIDVERQRQVSNIGSENDSDKSTIHKERKNNTKADMKKGVSDLKEKK